jgi:hypothetical protein
MIMRFGGPIGGDDEDQAQVRPRARVLRTEAQRATDARTAAEMRAAGHTFPDIGRVLGCSAYWARELAHRGARATR